MYHHESKCRVLIMSFIMKQDFKRVTTKRYYLSSHWSVALLENLGWCDVEPQFSFTKNPCNLWSTHTLVLNLLTLFPNTFSENNSVKFFWQFPTDIITSLASYLLSNKLNDLRKWITFTWYVKFMYTLRVNHHFYM